MPRNCFDYWLVCFAKEKCLFHCKAKHDDFLVHWSEINFSPILFPLTGVFCLSLIENGKRLGLGSAVASRVYKYLLEECNRYLSADDCSCKVQVDFSSIRSLITLARTAVTSKPACMLNSDESQHITSLTVQAFLQSVPSASSNIFGRTLVVGLGGLPVSDSAVFPGLLVDVPILQVVNLTKCSPGPYKIVLFGTSLSGDCSEIGEAALEIQMGINPEKVVLEQLLKLGERVVQEGVGVFACQKVIHPVLQQYLKERGVVVIERLGLALMEPVTKMTGQSHFVFSCCFWHTNRE